MSAWFESYSIAKGSKATMGWKCFVAEHVHGPEGTGRDLQVATVSQARTTPNLNKIAVVVNNNKGCGVAMILFPSILPLLSSYPVIPALLSWLVLPKQNLRSSIHLISDDPLRG